MDIKEIKIELGKDWSGYQDVLISALSNDNLLVSQINTYLIKNAGKQLRPILSLLSAKACGELIPANYYCAAVSEMIHTATLLHDDVADDGDFRRGVPTVKAVFSQAASILSGDYWLARALHLLTTYCGPQILSCFTTAVQELAEGELIQMEKAESLDTTELDYYTIIAKKTASLFVAAARSAALAVCAEPRFVEAVTSYAYELGIAFQIRDDIFDYSPDLNTGKTGGADIKERKITLPLICAMKKSPPAVAADIKSKINGIENTITKGGEIKESESKVIEQVRAFVIQYSGVESAQEILAQRSRKAVEALSVLPQTKAKQRLVQLAEFVGTRNQ